MPFIIDADPVAFTLVGIPVRWYGITLVIAIAVAYAIAVREARRRDLPDGLVADGAVLVGIAALVGGRLLYALQNGIPGLAEHPAHLLMVWMGGLSFYGGLAVGLLAVVAFARHRHVPWRVAADVVAPAAAIGQAIGHVGCLIGGDSAGVPTGLPWGVVYVNPGAMAPLGVPLHPVQAYEAIALSLLFLVLWGLRRRLTPVPGLLASAYLVGVAAIRFGLFFLRDEPGVLLGLKTAQLISVALLVLAAWVAVTSLRAASRTVERPALPVPFSP